MRIEQHPKLVITYKDIDKINEATNLINSIFDEFIDLDYGDDEKLNDLAIEFENAKDKLLDFFDKILCEDEYGYVMEIKES